MFKDCIWKVDANTGSLALCFVDSDNASKTNRNVLDNLWIDLEIFVGKFLGKIRKEILIVFFSGALLL